MTDSSSEAGALCEKALAVHARLCKAYNAPFAFFRDLDPLSELVGSLLLLLLMGLMGAGCDQQASTAGSREDGGEKNKQQKAVVPYTEGRRIAWAARTRRRLFDGPASYPRMIRLQSGALLASVESRGGSYVLRSEDEGATWSDLIEVAAPRNGVAAAVPSLLQLENGTVLLAYNTRPPFDNADPTRRFGIKLKTSINGGRTWEDGATVFEAGISSERGVWEPAMVQLPSGELQLFVANEYPYPDSEDQEISVFRSADGGATWSDFETVSYRAEHRDGMPVPLILSGTEEIVLSIEDNGLVSGPFKPALIGSGAAEEAWAGGLVGGDSPRRWAALGDDARLPTGTYAGAPYLAQLPGGETLLSFQQSDARSGNLEEATMVVVIGSSEARVFSRPSRPFEVPEGRRALWNSLFVKNDSTVTALSSTTAFNDAHQEFYVIDGHTLAEPRAHHGTITVDGQATEPAWAQAVPLRVGAYSSKRVEVKTAWDEERLYALAHVKDVNIVSASGLTGGEDGVWISLALDKLTENRLVAGTYRLRVEADGDYALEQGAEGRWQAVEAAAEVEVRLSEIRAAERDGFFDQEYVVEMSVPWSALGGRPSGGQGWGLNAGLVNAERTGRLTREAVAGNDPDHPRSWSRAMLVE